MDQFFSRLLDRISDYIAGHRGVPVLVCIPLVILNYILRFIPATNGAFNDLFLHLAVILGLVGILLGEAL